MLKMKVSMAPGRRVDNKVACIKAWRQISGLGLKEAKDAVEAVMENQPQVIEIVNKPDENVMRECLQVLRAEGMLVVTQSPVRDIALRAVETSAKLALENHEYDLAIDLTNILKKYNGNANG